MKPNKVVCYALGMRVCSVEKEQAWQQIRAKGKVSTAAESRCLCVSNLWEEAVFKA